MNDQEIELEIQAKGLTATRLTPADIEAVIEQEEYFTAGQGMLGAHVWGNYGDLNFDHETFAWHPFDMVTICVLMLKNGTKVVGVNTGPVSPSNFNAELGKKMARQEAVDQIWPMLGYELRSKLVSM